MKSTILHNRKKQLLHLLFLAAVMLSFLLDSLVHSAMIRIHNPFFDMIFRFFSDATVISLFILLISITMLKIKKDHRWIPALFSSMIVTAAISYLLKFLIARLRPGGFELISVFGMIDYSFPSFHTALAFSMIPLLDRSFHHHRRIWIAMGVMVGLSRLYLRMHFFSDVLAGAFIGLLCGELMLLLEKKYGWFTWISKKIWN